MSAERDVLRDLVLAVDATETGWADLDEDAYNADRALLRAVRDRADVLLAHPLLSAVAENREGT